MCRIQVRARPDQLEGMVRYGIDVESKFGMSIPELRKLVKEIEKSHDLFST